MTRECVNSDYMTVESIVAAASVFLNVTLMLLIGFATPKELRDYARVLLSSCVLELLVTASAYLFETVFF